MTQSATDIIQRSIELHPSLFIEALKTRAQEDYTFADQRSGAAARAGYASAKAAELAASALEHDEDASAFAMASMMSAGIIALGVACRLQCLPHHVRTAAAVATWGETEGEG